MHKDRESGTPIQPVAVPRLADQPGLSLRHFAAVCGACDTYNLSLDGSPALLGDLHEIAAQLRTDLDLLIVALEAGIALEAAEEPQRPRPAAPEPDYGKPR